MAKKEEVRDPLFSTNLGDGLIEVNDEPEKEAGAVVEDQEDKDKKQKPELPYKEYDDGMIEIDEYFEKTKDNQETGEKGQEFIENTDKETEEKDKKAPSEGKGSGDSSSPSSSQYLAFARDRAEEGVFLEFNDEDWKGLVEKNNGDEAAALRELSEVSMQTMIEDGIERYKQSLTDEDRALYEAKEKGIPVDKYGIAKRNLEEYSKIKPEDLEENVTLQEKVMSKVLEIRGFSKDEIKEEIEGYKALETLKSKAEKALPLLPKKFEKDLKDLEEAAKAEDDERKDKIRQNVARMKRLVETTPEIIPGIKLNKNSRDTIMQSLMQPVAKDEFGNPMNLVMATRSKNPDAFEMMIHYYHSLGLFNIDDDGNAKPDFSKINKVAATKASSKMREAFEAKEKQVSGKTSLIQTKDEEDDEWDKAFRRL